MADQCGRMFRHWSRYVQAVLSSTRRVTATCYPSNLHYCKVYMLQNQGKLDIGSFKWFSHSARIQPEKHGSTGSRFRKCLFRRLIQHNAGILACYSSYKESDVTKKHHLTLRNYLHIAESENQSVPKMINMMTDLLNEAYRNDPFHMINTAFANEYVRLSRKRRETLDCFSHVNLQGFERLMDIVETKESLMSPSEKAHVYFCFMRLGAGMSPCVDHPLMLKLFRVLQDPPGQLSFIDIAKFSSVLMARYGTILPLQNLFHRHLDHLQREGFLTGTPQSEFLQNIPHNAGYAIRDSDMASFIQTLLYATLDSTYTVLFENYKTIWPLTIFLLSRLSYSHHFESSWFLLQKIQNNIHSVIVQNKGNLDCYDLGFLSSRYSLVVNHALEDPAFQEILTTRADDILRTKENMTLLDSLLIMGCYPIPGFHLSEEGIMILENQLKEKLHEADPKYFQFICICFAGMMTSRNRDFLLKSQKLLNYLGFKNDRDYHPMKAIILFEKRKYMKMPEENFIDFVKDRSKIKNLLGVNSYNIVALAESLQVSDAEVRKEVVESILRYCEFYPLSFLVAVAARFLKLRQYKIECCQVTDIYIEILKMIAAKTEVCTSLQSLIDCIGPLTSYSVMANIRFGNVDVIGLILGKMSELMLESDSLDDIMKLTQHLIPQKHFTHNFHLPTRVLDSIVKQILDQEEILEVEKFVKLSRILSCGRMSAEKREVLEEFAEVFFEENMDGMKLENVLSVLDNLILADVYPRKTLRRVMRVEYLDYVDQYITDGLHKGIDVELITFLMIRLNRSVVLDMPELNIPWFSKDLNVPDVYCHPGGTLRRPDIFLSKVGRALTDILEDENIKFRCFTKYKHHVFCEFFLDSSKKPVPTSMIDSDRPLKPGVQKYAIDVLRFFEYPLNDQTKLTANSLQKKRHLEKEGYKYIQMRYDDLRSLAMSAESDVRNSLWKKIFLDEEREHAKEFELK